jgi:opacity protein-like surface antigen
MQHTFQKFWIVAFGLLATVVPAVAQAQEDKFYLKGDLGAAWTMETSLADISRSTGPQSGEVTFDTGARFGAVGGYKVTDWFAVEAELGLCVSPLRSAEGLAPTVSGELFNLPFLANVHFQYPNRSRFTPYVGGGVGGSIALLHADPIVLSRNEIFTVFRTLQGTESTVVFAYQAFAGVEYALNRNMSVGLEYHFFGTTGPEWDAFQIRFGATEVHSASVSFSYRF